MLGHLRRYLGAVRLQPSIDRPCNGEHEQNGDNGKPLACHGRLLVGLALLLLSLCERFAGMASVAASLDDRYENIMREFHPAGVVAVFIGEEPAVDQFIENGLGDIGQESASSRAQLSRYPVVVRSLSSIKIRRPTGKF